MSSIVLSVLRLPLASFILLLQSAALALGQIWANKTRSILTTIGIVIGVASVTAVIAALTGLKTNVLTEFESLGTNKMFIHPYWTGRISRKGSDKWWVKFWLHTKDFDGLLEHCPSVKAFTRECSLSKTIQYAGKIEEQSDITGIEPAWHEVENRSVVIGRSFSLIDIERERAVCLVNAALQQKLGLPIDPTGEAIFIGERRYRIVGVVETRAQSGMFGGGGSGSEVFLPYSTAMRGSERPVGVVATCRSPDVSEEAKAEITFFLRHKRGLRVGEPDNFRVEVIQQMLDEFNKVAATITIVATGVVGISLLVGGVGIMNIMLVSVSERTREIGLRKAVGARPAAILLQFLVEATMLCLMGGLIGLLGGQGLTAIVARLPDAHLDKATIPGWAIALSFGFSAAVGLVFGMFPAIKAARLDPIDALRHE